MHRVMLKSAGNRVFLQSPCEVVVGYGSTSNGFIHYVLNDIAHKTVTFGEFETVTYSVIRGRQSG